MANNKNKRTLFLVIWLAIASLMSTAIASRASFAADSRNFPETGHTVQGLFLNYWNTRGGLAQQGYPISEELQEQNGTDGKVYTVQYFQRAVFEYHPENVGTQFEVLLSLLGVFYYNDKYSGSAPAQRTSTDNPRLFDETGFTIGGAFREYWESHGGLAQQGYPISEEFTEVDKDGTPRTVQYFQRAVFEYHSEYAGTPSQVLLSLLGVFYYDKQHSGAGTPTPPSATPTPAPPPTSRPIDSAVVWNNGKAYFFSGNQYIRYDVATDRTDDIPHLISDGWRGLFTSNIDAAVMWNNGKAYFFKGNQYVRYDVATDRTDDIPHLISDGWRGLVFP
ncbi:MAG TPA: hemopexin repeat-containing protein [Chloroflexia bacterium]|nr:hemopexin repeat-containing protein [Chloroflexia bacterium]